MNADVNRTMTAVVPQDTLRNPYAPRLVAAGDTFDVIEVEDQLGEAALQVLYTRGVPTGPVICDRRYRRVGFLVPPEPVAPVAPRDRGVGPRHHGRGAWITVPPPPTYNDDGPLVWLVQPASDGRLTSTRHVRAAIAQAARELAEEPPRY